MTVEYAIKSHGKLYYQGDSLKNLLERKKRLGLTGNIVKIITTVVF